MKAHNLHASYIQLAHLPHETIVFYQRRYTPQLTAMRQRATREQWKHIVDEQAAEAKALRGLWELARRGAVDDSEQDDKRFELQVEWAQYLGNDRLMGSIQS